MASLQIKEDIERTQQEIDLDAKNSGKAPKDRERMPERQEIDTCDSPVWVTGTVIFISGSILNFVAFAFAPQSILASLEGIQFATNVLFAKFVLGSHISLQMYAGTATTIVGVMLTVAAASVVGTLEADVDDLLALWANPLWIFYVIFCGAVGFVLQSVQVTYNRAEEAGAPLPHSDYVRPIAYATFSALFGTFSVVLAKILSELVTLLFEGTNIFWGPQAWFTYVMLFSWLGFVGVWLYRMNEALSLYDPLFIIPLLQVNFILFAIVSGGIYFKEFSYFEPINTAGFLGGVVLLVLGIFLLSPELGTDGDSFDNDHEKGDIDGQYGDVGKSDTDAEAQREADLQRLRVSLEASLPPPAGNGGAFVEGQPAPQIAPQLAAVPGSFPGSSGTQSRRKTSFRESTG